MFKAANLATGQRPAHVVPFATSMTRACSSRSHAPVGLLALSTTVQEPLELERTKNINKRNSLNNISL